MFRPGVGRADDRLYAFRVLMMCVRYHLIPVHRRRRHRPNGRQWRLDLAFEVRAIVEVAFAKGGRLHEVWFLFRWKSVQRESSLHRRRHELLGHRMAEAVRVNKWRRLRVLMRVLAAVMRRQKMLGMMILKVLAVILPFRMPVMKRVNWVVLGMFEFIRFRLHPLIRQRVMLR